MKRTPWVDRKFSNIEDNALLPSIIERLDGTFVRISDKISRTNPELQTVKKNGKWSIREHIGHLGDLEPLWLRRVDDFVNGLSEMRAADMTNKKTHKANHNAVDAKVLLQRFHEQRMEFVWTVRSLSDEQLLLHSLHPRLKISMRIVDLAYFVAEHDDHHLADIREIISVSE